MGGKDIFVQICTTFFPPILTVSFFGKIQRSIWTISSQFCNLYVEIYQIIVKIRSHKFSKIVNRKGKPLSSRVSKKSCTKLCNVRFFNTLQLVRFRFKISVAVHSVKFFVPFNLSVSLQNCLVPFDF